MRWSPPRFTLVMSWAAALGCEPVASTSAEARLLQPVLYGYDDRVEAAAAARPVWREAARRSVAALIPTTHLRQEGDELIVEAPTLAERFGVCGDERLADQPSAALCSGVLLDETTLLTAGHCLVDTATCRDGFKIVFGYLTSATLPLRIPSAFVFDCSAVKAHRNDVLTAKPSLDYALLELSRPAASPFAPVTLAPPELAERSALALIGTSEGLPLKIDETAQLLALEPEAGVAKIAADSFIGDSGAPLLAEDGSLVGIVAGGQPDYETREGEACLRRRQADARQPHIGEQITLATSAERDWLLRPTAPALAGAPGTEPPDLALSSPTPDAPACSFSATRRDNVGGIALLCVSLALLSARRRA